MMAASEITHETTLDIGREAPHKGTSPSAEALRRLRRNPIALLSAGLIVLMVLAALLAALIAPHPYDMQDRAYTLASSIKGHPLGTDNLGYDTASRLIYGARVSL